MTTIKLFRFSWRCLILLAALIPQWAHTAEAPSIELVESPAIDRGANDHLKIIGANLAKTREAIFYSRGITCQAVQVISDEELVIQLNVESDCATGMHAFRLRSDEGFSELRTFAVTPYPVVRPVDSPTKLTMGRSVLGQLTDRQSQTYTIALAAGDRLALDVEAIRLGIEMTDTALTVRDPDGQIVAQADDSHLYRQDPVLSFIAKKVGQYAIEVSDAGRNSGQQAHYILHVGDGPRPLTVFPLGGQPGSTIQLTYLGDCQGKWTTSQYLPDLSPEQFQNFQLFAVRDNKSSATPLPFRLSSLPNFLETASNDDWITANAASGQSGASIQVPLALNGTIDKALDRDCYWVSGAHGQLLEVDVYAQRLGSAADTKLTIVDSDQRVLAQSDDVDSLDSRAEIVVPQDGKFGIAIEEKRGKGGEAFVYRVEVAPARRTAEVFLPRRDRMTQDLQTIAVPSGNRVLALMAVRKDVANGQASLRFPSLPEGVVAHFSQPAADQAIVPVVFEAKADVQSTGQLVPVEVSVYSQEGTTQGQFHQVTDLVMGPADAIYTQHDTNRLALGTRSAYPVSVSVSQPKAALGRDGTLDLMVNIERREDVSGDVSLTLPWLPAWVDAEPRVIVPANETKAIIRLRAWKQAAVATWPFVVEASIENAARRRPSRGGPVGVGGVVSAGDTPPPAGVVTQAVASLPVYVKVTEPPASGHFDVAAAEQGQSVEVACKFQATPELSAMSDLVASLEGLPNRVECEPVSIKPESQSIPFKVRLEPTAPLGQYSGLSCRLTGTLSGEKVSYIISRDGELTIAEPGQIVRDAAGRPLNRVEALRNKVSQGSNKTDAR